MGKREVIGMTEAWWVWLGEEPAIRVVTEADATSLMLANENENAPCDAGQNTGQLLPGKAPGKHSGFSRFLPGKPRPSQKQK